MDPSLYFADKIMHEDKALLLALKGDEAYVIFLQPRTRFKIYQTKSKLFPNLKEIGTWYLMKYYIIKPQSSHIRIKSTTFIDPPIPTRVINRGVEVVLKVLYSQDSFICEYCDVQLETQLAHDVRLRKSMELWCDFKQYAFTNHVYSDQEYRKVKTTQPMERKVAKSMSTNSVLSMSSAADASSVLQNARMKKEEDGILDSNRFSSAPAPTSNSSRMFVVDQLGNITAPTEFSRQSMCEGSKPSISGVSSRIFVVDQHGTVIPPENFGTIDNGCAEKASRNRHASTTSVNSDLNQDCTQKKNIMTGNGVIAFCKGDEAMVAFLAPREHIRFFLTKWRYFYDGGVIGQWYEIDYTVSMAGYHVRIWNSKALEPPPAPTRVVNECIQIAVKVYMSGKHITSTYGEVNRITDQLLVKQIQKMNMVIAWCSLDIEKRQLSIRELYNNERTCPFNVDQTTTGEPFADGVDFGDVKRKTRRTQRATTTFAVSSSPAPSYDGDFSSTSSRSQSISTTHKQWNWSATEYISSGLLIEVKGDELFLLLRENRARFRKVSTKRNRFGQLTRLGIWYELRYLANTKTEQHIKVVAVHEIADLLPTRVFNGKVNFLSAVYLSELGDHFLCEFGKISTISAADAEVARNIGRAGILAWCASDFNKKSMFYCVVALYDSTAVNTTSIGSRTSAAANNRSKDNYADGCATSKSGNNGGRRKAPYIRIGTPMPLVMPEIDGHRLRKDLGVVCSASADNRILYVYARNFALELTVDAVAAAGATGTTTQPRLGMWLDFVAQEAKNGLCAYEIIAYRRMVKPPPFNVLACRGTIFVQCDIDVPSDFLTSRNPLKCDFARLVVDHRGLITDRVLGSTLLVVLRYVYEDGDPNGYFIIDTIRKVKCRY